MPTPKETYQQVKIDINTLADAVAVFKTAYSSVDNYNQIIGVVDDTDFNLTSIETWANDNIRTIEENEVINTFLASLKTLMVEYSAKFEVGNETGYGEAYGKGSFTGIRAVVEKDGIITNKIFEGLVFDEGDL